MNSKKIVGKTIPFLFFLSACSAHQHVCPSAATIWRVENSKVISVEYFSPTSALQKGSAPESDDFGQLIFKDSDGRKEISRETNDDQFLSMFVTGESGGRLVTVWMGGSSYHFIVYSYENDKIKRVLETGSKLMISLERRPNRNETLQVYHFDKGIAETLETYEWGGDKYVSHTKRVH